MDDSNSPGHLRLAEALVRWCAPELVAAVRNAECEHTAHDLESTDFFTLANQSAWRQPLEREWMLGPPNFSRLFAAWDRLLDDFRRRIEQAEIYLEGALSTPDGATQAQAIPNAWAAELKFDFRRNTVSRGDQRYLAITVSKTPSSWAPVEQQTEEFARRLPPLDDRTVRELTDEEILLLLEEHARRVVEGGSEMMTPGHRRGLRLSRWPTTIRSVSARSQAKGAIMKLLSAPFAQVGIVGRARLEELLTAIVPAFGRPGRTFRALSSRSDRREPRSVRWSAADQQRPRPQALHSEPCSVEKERPQRRLACGLSGRGRPR